MTCITWQLVTDDDMHVSFSIAVTHACNSQYWDQFKMHLYTRTRRVAHCLNGNAQFVVLEV